MYQPGDYIVGYPDYYESDDGKRYKTGSGRIIYCENKWSMIAQKLRSDGYNMPWPLIDIATGNKDSKGKKVFVSYMPFQELQGMIVEIDELDSERPHWNGLVRVITGEKICGFGPVMFV